MTWEVAAEVPADDDVSDDDFGPEVMIRLGVVELAPTVFPIAQVQHCHRDT
jgi:hypothetical protein